MEIWAKSKGIRLSKHINDILNVFEKIKNKVKENLHLPIKISIFYHDLGKVLPMFQIEVLENKTYEPFDIIHNIPHSLFSIFWMNCEKIREKISSEGLVKMIISSVAYHHWRDNFDDYIMGKKDLKMVFEFVLEKKDDLKNNLQNEINLISDSDLKDFITLDINEKLINEVKNGVILQKIAIPPYKFDYEPLRGTITQSIDDTKKWILISGFLQRCDHFASWCEEENENLNNIEISNTNDSDIKNRIKEKIGIDDNNKIWQFSKVQEVKDKNAILIAPTGYGKTEFAFLWSINRKFIYTLPLRSAVNQIYDRSEKIYGTDKTGILHSDVDVYLLEKWGDVGDHYKLYELSKNLSFPVIVSTGDQFFPYALKPPGYEKIFSLFSYSNLVIDEVQAYDPKACAIIVKFLQWVKTMGGNFLLMTATMPEFVSEALTEELRKISKEEPKWNEINIYEERKADFKRVVKHKVKITFIENKENVFEIPEEILEEVINEAQNGKRVLLILNTVKQAQNTYNKIKEKIQDCSIKLFLFHSMFTFEDRRKKEIEVISKEFKNPKPEDEKEGKILIATQVVEASLDIDADILFTEICPLDALIQRMGRVLRRIKLDKEFEIETPNVYILVFKKGLESGRGKVYEKELLKLSLSWLWKKSEIDIDSLDFSKENKDEFFKNEFKKLFKNKNQNDSLLKKIINEDKWIEEININQFQFNEYEKYKIVQLFYKSLPEDGCYLKKFYETLEILSAGYMSDKKVEAEKIFREIYDITVVPKNTLDDFIKMVDGFDYDNKKFTEFKKEILSKFVVSVPYLKIEEKDWVFYTVQEKISDEKKLKKLKKWLSGIFVSSQYIYDKKLGTVKTEGRGVDNIL